MKLDGKKSYLGAALFGLGKVLLAIPEPICQILGVGIEAFGASLFGIGAAHKLSKLKK